MDSGKITLSVYRHENPIVNDAYDRLMASLLLNRSKGLPNTFTFLGVSPKVGTTTIAINAAVSLANANWKTLLIDGDFRKGKGEKRLSEQVERGLSDLLGGAAAPEEVICETNFQNLSYLSCGSNLDNPVQLLCARAFEDFLEEEKSKFDFVIFDSSAINTAVDATLLAKAASNAILVVGQKSTRVGEYESALGELEKTGANLLGVVMNKISKEEYSRHLKNYNYFFKDRARKNKSELKRGENLL